MAQEQEYPQEFADEQPSLWRITLGPTIWAIHFLASYAAAAVWCAKGPWGPISDRVLSWGIGIGALVALAAIAWIARGAWRQWNYPDDWDYVHEAATDEDRHEFLGHAAFLLAIVSFIGVIYTALPAIFAGTCL
ncbi:MAG: hypothetical protein ACU0AT_11415 [Tranquillimonas sp.]